MAQIDVKFASRDAKKQKIGNNINLKEAGKRKKAEEKASKKK